MRICFILAACSLVGPHLWADPSARAPYEASSVVRADQRSGRLVRRVVVPQRVVSPKVIKPVAVARKATPARQYAPGDIDWIVQDAARRHGISPLLVHSVIHVESSYNPYAVSPKGAQGLMQLIPSTARRFGVVNVFNPQENIEGGARYLRHLTDLFRGDLRLVLAAYNAGEGAVFKHNWIPPFRETQDYVVRVGRKLGQLRAQHRAAEATTPAPPPIAPAHASLDRYVDSEGRLHLRTR